MKFLETFFAIPSPEPLVPCRSPAPYRPLNTRFSVGGKWPPTLRNSPVVDRTLEHLPIHFAL